MNGNKPTHGTIDYQCKCSEFCKVRFPVPSHGFTSCVMHVECPACLSMSAVKISTIKGKTKKVKVESRLLTASDKLAKLLLEEAEWEKAQKESPDVAP